MTWRRFNRAREVIPRRPWKSKSPFASRPMKTSINKGTRGVRARYDAVRPPSHGPTVVQSYRSQQMLLSMLARILVKFLTFSAALAIFQVCEEALLQQAVGCRKWGRNKIENGRSRCPRLPFPGNGPFFGLFCPFSLSVFPPYAWGPTKTHETLSSDVLCLPPWTTPKPSHSKPSHPHVQSWETFLSEGFWGIPRGRKLLPN